MTMMARQAGCRATGPVEVVVNDVVAVTARSLDAGSAQSPAPLALKPS